METFPYKLKLARKAAGLSQDQLADKLGITKQAISLYERGTTKPDSTRLLDFAKALNRPLAFFFSKPRLDLEKISFRKRSKLTGTRLNKVKADVSSHVENLLEIEEALGLNEEFTKPNFGKFELSEANSEVDDAAEILRKNWKLGLDPIADISALLVAKGIRLIEVEADTDFDGLSTMVNDRIPVIVINISAHQEGEKPDKVRRRITLIHELAHLILPFKEGISHKDEEKICNRFGASFLIPPKVLQHELGVHRHRIALAEFKRVRRVYGISVAALVYQAGTYNILPEYIVQAYWRKRRKNPDLLNEKGFGGAEAEGSSGSYLKQLVIRGLVEGLVSESRAASILNKDISYVRDLALGVPGLGLQNNA